MYAPDTRERSRPGTSAEMIEPPVMSRSMTPKPERNSDRKRQPSTTQRGPPASGTSTSGAGQITQPAMNAGPTPIHLVIRPVTTEPSTPPDRCDAEHETEHPGAGLQHATPVERGARE